MNKLIRNLVVMGSGKFIFSDDFSADKTGWTGATWAIAGGNCANTPNTTGSELVTNGTFASDANWGKPTNGTISGGKAVFNDVAAFSAFTQGIGERSNKQVRISYDLLDYSAGSFRTGLGGKYSATKSANGSYVSILTGLSTNAFLYLYSQSAHSVFNIDNVSAFLLDISTLFRMIVSPSQYGKVEASWTGMSDTLAGVVMCLDNPANPQNYVFACHDGTNFKMFKVVGAVMTSLIDTAVAYSAGAKVAILRAKGSNVFRGFYNGSQVGTDQAITDAGIINNKYHGLYSTHPTPVCGDFLYQNF